MQAHKRIPRQCAKPLGLRCHIVFSRKRMTRKNKNKRKNKIKQNKNNRRSMETQTKLMISGKHEKCSSVMLISLSIGII